MATVTVRRISAVRDEENLQWKLFVKENHGRLLEELGKSR